MTKEEFTKKFSEDPNSDEVLQEINRLYDEESRLTADFAQADSERTNYKTQLDAANRRYRERFLSGTDPDNKDDADNNEPPTINDLFKED